MKERYLITGAAGFIGSQIAKSLVASKKEVVVILRSKKSISRLAGFEKKLKIHVCDLRRKELEKIVTGIRPTHVFHLASYGVKPDDSNVKQMFETNFLGTVNLLSVIKKIPLKLFINTGSSSEYGVYGRSISEADLLKPVNDYGVSKAASTLYCQKEALRDNLPLVTFRLFSVYGPGEDGKRFIPYVINRALEQKEIQLSDPGNVRDFVYVEDVVRAYTGFKINKLKPGSIYNLGSGKQSTLKNVVDEVLNITGSNSVVSWNTYPAQKRQIEPAIWKADISKIKKEQDWKPRFSLTEGLKKTIQNFR